MSEVDFDDVLARYLLAGDAGDMAEQQRVLADHPEFAQQLNSFLRIDAALQRRLSPADPCRLDVAFPRPNSSQLDDDPSRTRHYAGPDGRQTLAARWVAGFSTSEEEFPVAFGDYDLLNEIDRGGMGIVFRACHRNLGRMVALKVMRSGELASAEELQRFRAETEAAAVIEHPNIVPIYEVGQVKGLTFYTMPFIEGQDLGSLLRQREIEPVEAARILVKIADAVATAHRNGIIHRDLKPSNILIDRRGEPHLIDFGLAKLNHRSTELTCTGQVLGTPAYMSPEQARGSHESSPAMDVYSLGAVLYALVTRQPPFSGPTPFDIMLQVVDRDPPSPRRLNRKVHRTLEAVIQRAMRKDGRERYPTAEAFRNDLQRFLLGEPIEWPRQSPAQRMTGWWRREPILLSHLLAIGTVLVIVVLSAGQNHLSLKVGLLVTWIACSFLFQHLSLTVSRRPLWYLSWAVTDVTLYTLLIYLADKPRGLLLAGYPLMIAASGLFYQVRFVTLMTGLCLAGFTILYLNVDDPFTERLDFALIYASVLVVLGCCLLSMIRRVRGLTDCFHPNDPPAPVDADAGSPGK